MSHPRRLEPLGPKPDACLNCNDVNSRNLRSFNPGFASTSRSPGPRETEQTQKPTGLTHRTRATDSRRLHRCWGRAVEEPFGRESVIYESLCRMQTVSSSTFGQALSLRSDACGARGVKTCFACAGSMYMRVQCEERVTLPGCSLFGVRLLLVFRVSTRMLFCVRQKTSRVRTNMNTFPRFENMRTLSKARQLSEQLNVRDSCFLLRRHNHLA